MVSAFHVILIFISLYSLGSPSFCT